MAVKKLPLSAARSSESHRTYWKATLRSAPPLAFFLMRDWDERVRIFRWKWLARAAACIHEFTAGRHVLKEAVIEPYFLGANVISLSDRRLAPRRRPYPGP